MGFAYDMLSDTASEVANEMVDNLSLDNSEASYIASLIQVCVCVCFVCRVYAVCVHVLV